MSTMKNLPQSHRVAELTPTVRVSASCLWSFGFVDAQQLHELVAPGLIRRDDALGAEVLNHAFVGVVGGADTFCIFQYLDEHIEGHRFDPHAAPAGKRAENLEGLRSEERRVGKECRSGWSYKK